MQKSYISYLKRSENGDSRLYIKPAHLKLHGDVLLILWHAVALLVVGEVVGCAGVDDC